MISSIYSKSRLVGTPGQPGFRALLLLIIVLAYAGFSFAQQVTRLDTK